MELLEFAEICRRAARAGGGVLGKMAGKTSAREKGPSDLVTEADLASQQAIREIVLGAFPDHAFLGEEDAPTSAKLGAQSQGLQWVVDPLDGTTNFVHGLENYCVSVALCRDNLALVGCVYDPVRDRSYEATLGQGASCNGTSIHVSDCRSLRDALVAASLAARVAPESEEVKRFLAVLYRCQALRRLGSAALNLCYLAEGRLDGYWATSVKKWDVAAGLLIVKEAGGVITNLGGDAVSLESPQFVAAASSPLHAELLASLALADGDIGTA